jgi:hypothetical protein
LKYGRTRLGICRKVLMMAYSEGFLARESLPSL